MSRKEQIEKLNQLYKEVANISISLYDKEEMKMEIETSLCYLLETVNKLSTKGLYFNIKNMESVINYVTKCNMLGKPLGFKFMLYHKVDFYSAIIFITEIDKSRDEIILDAASSMLDNSFGRLRGLLGYRAYIGDSLGDIVKPTVYSKVQIPNNWRNIEFMSTILWDFDRLPDDKVSESTMHRKLRKRSNIELHIKDLKQLMISNNRLNCNIKHGKLKLFVNGEEICKVENN